MVKSSVKAADVNTPAIIGTFEGECADSNITNKNGLDITREVWENVFASEEYAEGIEHGWLIGYLGHPEDPACQDFMNGCIVMTDGYIDDNGKIYGKFNLIDTPVGQVVKKFIDAGVKFGISVRGAGDIYNNSVDPDTFVFRGFDLVAFPAYPESVPEFTAIAASTDVETQKKYKAVCAAVRTNLDAINSAEALDVIQAQFAKQSDEYKLIEDKKNEIRGCDNAESVEESEEVDIRDQRVSGMTQLYLDTKNDLARTKARFKRLNASSRNRISELKKINASLNSEISTLNNHIAIMESASGRKISTMERITASQMDSMKSELKKSKMHYQMIKASNDKLKGESLKLHDKNTQLIESNKKLTTSNKQLITANERLKEENKSLTSSNLIYKQRIEATANDIDEKDSVISELRSELRETVTANTDIEARTSNLDAKIQKLKQEVSAATKLIQEYQDAYANLYANAIGVHLEDVRVTSATSVQELQSIIGSSLIGTNQTAIQPTELADIDFISDDTDDDLVTL